MRKLIYIVITLIITGCRFSGHHSETHYEMNKDNTKDNSNNFVSCVLLSEPKWDKEKLLKDLNQECNISSLSEQENDILAGEVDDCTVGITLIPNPIPNGEAESYADDNYLWPNAVEIVKSHKAHILITVMGNCDVIKTAKITTKVVDACLQQENTIAVFNEIAVYEPKTYHEAAQSLHQNNLPTYNWIWLGIYNNGDVQGIYTYGMRQFGKEEIEVFANAKTEDIYEFVFDIVNYVINYDVTLKSGETIGFTENEKLPITISNGIAVDGESIKIAYPSK